MGGEPLKRGKTYPDGFHSQVFGGAISVNSKEAYLGDREPESRKMCMVIESRHGFGRNNIAFHNRYTSRKNKYAAYRTIGHR